MQKIVTALKNDPETQSIPVVLFTKGGGQWLEMIADTGCDGIGLDFTVDIADARQRVGDQVALQGNMDPVVMNTNPEVVIQQAKKVIDSYGKHCSGQGHVFNFCLLYTSPSPRDKRQSRMPSSA